MAFQRTDEEKRILRAIRSMPFAPQVRVEPLEAAVTAREPITLGHLASYLELLSTELVAAARRVHDTDDQLVQLLDDLAACGRVLQRAQSVAR